MGVPFDWLDFLLMSLAIDRSLCVWLSQFPARGKGAVCRREGCGNVGQDCRGDSACTATSRCKHSHKVINNIISLDGNEVMHSMSILNLALVQAVLPFQYSQQAKRIRSVLCVLWCGASLCGGI